MSPTNIPKLSVAIGLTSYIVSFVLPAIELPSSGSMGSNIFSGGSIKGFLCALYALIAPLSSPTPGSLLALAAGSVNVLALLSLAARRLDWPEEHRCVVALAAIALIPFSLPAIGMLHASIRIGHVVWVSGLLLFLVPELVQYARGGRQ
jgi:hypothetical protein